MYDNELDEDKEGAKREEKVFSFNMTQKMDDSLIDGYGIAIFFLLRQYI